MRSNTKFKPPRRSVQRAACGDGVGRRGCASRRRLCQDAGAEVSCSGDIVLVMAQLKG
jgi:hypothetical protein